MDNLAKLYGVWKRQMQGKRQIPVLRARGPFGCLPILSRIMNRRASKVLRLNFRRGAEKRTWFCQGQLRPRLPGLALNLPGRKQALASPSSAALNRDRLIPGGTLGLRSPDSWQPPWPATHVQVCSASAWPWDTGSASQCLNARRYVSTSSLRQPEQRTWG